MNGIKAYILDFSWCVDKLCTYFFRNVSKFIALMYAIIIIVAINLL